MDVEFVDRVIGVFADAVAHRKFKLGHRGVVGGGCLSCRSVGVVSCRVDHYNSISNPGSWVGGHLNLKPDSLKLKTRAFSLKMPEA